MHLSLLLAQKELAKLTPSRFSLFSVSLLSASFFLIWSFFFFFTAEIMHSNLLLLPTEGISRETWFSSNGNV